MSVPDEPQQTGEVDRVELQGGALGRPNLVVFDPDGFAAVVKDVDQESVDELESVFGEQIWGDR